MRVTSITRLIEVYGISAFERTKPVVQMRKTVPLSLTFDHRAVTGGEAARFLAAALADLEKPE